MGLVHLYECDQCRKEVKPDSPTKVALQARIWRADKLGEVWGKIIGPPPYPDSGSELVSGVYCSPGCGTRAVLTACGWKNGDADK